MTEQHGIPFSAHHAISHNAAYKSDQMSRCPWRILIITFGHYLFGTPVYMIISPLSAALLC